MATRVEICNRALARIGVNELIEDLQDPNQRSQQCLQHYDPCRQEALADFPWAFAQTVVALAPVAVDIPGYAHAYRYPTNCMRADVLTGAQGLRAPGAPSNSTFCSYDWLRGHRWPFRVMADPSTPGARIIATDLADAFLWYTVDVTDPNQMPPAFRSALAWRLAMDLALGLRADQRLAQNALQQYRLTDSVAQAADLNEGQPDAEPLPPSIGARI